MKVVALLLATLAISQAAPTVTTSLQQAYLKEDAVDIMIIMKSSTAQVLEQIETLNFPNTNAKATVLYEALNEFTSKSQKEVLSILSKYKSGRVQGFYITNRISVQAAPQELVKALEGRADIEEIREAKVMHIFDVVPSDPQALEWGVSQINGPEAWAAGWTGQGVVVSAIDTGVRHTHVALRGGFREEYGWFDPEGQTAMPNDQQGHGSHTMGTIAGRNGTGVAPNSQWTACKGCSSSSCSEFALIGCGQWTFCPTLTDGTMPRCDMKPALSSNSWGGGNEDPFYDEVINAWNSVDIIPVFAIGNAGPGCRTANSPGDRPNVISVGATNNLDEVAYFSSHGPTLQTSVIKPEVSAPGVNVRSCSHTSDTTFALLSGTSMACPHVAGAIALLVESGLNSRTDLAAALQDTTVRPNIEQIICTGGGVDPEDPWPNNSFGWGRIDVASALGVWKK